MSDKPQVFTDDQVASLNGYQAAGVTGHGNELGTPCTQTARDTPP